MIRSPDVLDAIGPTDRANLAKYLTIAKLRLENAIAVVRTGDTRPLAGRRPASADTKKPAPGAPASSFAGTGRVSGPWRPRARPSRRLGRCTLGLGGVPLGLRGVLRGLLLRSWPLPGFAAAHASGVTVVQSIVARVASFMWATQETKAPWLRKPSGVGIWAAADTSAPWVSSAAAPSRRRRPRSPRRRAPPSRRVLVSAVFGLGRLSRLVFVGAVGGRLGVRTRRRRAGQGRGREHDARGHREHDDGDAEAAEAADQVGQVREPLGVVVPVTRVTTRRRRGC